jgi:hypothetical protein
VLKGIKNKMNNEEYNQVPKELKNHGIDGIAQNPFKTYKVQFPYQVRFTIDGIKNTEIIINTKSEEFYYSRTKKDVLLMKELSDSHSELSLAKYIINYLNENMWTVNQENCHLTFTGEPMVSEMTEKELEEFQREILSANE